MKLCIGMVLQGKSFVEMYEGVEKLLEKYPRKCARCGKILHADDVMESQGWHCHKCWEEVNEELAKAEEG